VRPLQRGGGDSTERNGVWAWSSGNRGLPEGRLVLNEVDARGELDLRADQ
jgi:hypothetical protein